MEVIPWNYTLPTEAVEIVLSLICEKAKKYEYSLCGF